MEFMTKFVWEQRSQVLGDHALRKVPRFSHVNFAGLFDLETARDRIKDIRKNDPGLYSQHKDMIDLFFTGLDTAVSQAKKKTDESSSSSE